MPIPTIKHSTTQRDFKNNSKPGGLNHQIALENCICAFFNIWDEFKSKILNNGAANKIILPLLEYLKLIRHRLTHNKHYSEGITVIQGCKLKYTQHLLPAFSKGDSIQLTSADLDAIIDELRQWLDQSAL